MGEKTSTELNFTRLGIRIYSVPVAPCRSCGGRHGNHKMSCYAGGRSNLDSLEDLACKINSRIFNAATRS